MHFRALAATLTLSIAVLLAAQDWSGTGRLEGRVLDPDGQPLAGVTVRLDNPERGFAYRLAGPLDLRFDTSTGPTAASWLADADEATIADALGTYGEERHARKIARLIIAQKSRGLPILTTGDLVALIRQAVGAHGPELGRSAARVFQALRIAVNDVFAHPDDEASCVGTLANHSDAGDAVRLLWLSRGESTTVLQMDREAKIRERARQALQVGALLGAETGFLDFPDAGIVHTRENALVVSDVIRAWKPTIVITWNRHRSVGAGHPDHRNTHAIVLDAVSYARLPFAAGQQVHRERMSVYLTHEAPARHPLRLVDVSGQEERIRAFFAIYAGMYGAWPVEELIFARLTSHGVTASCRLAQAFEFVQLGKADRFLV